MLIQTPANATGDLLANTDWSATPLGPMEGWPQSLKIAVSICMNSRFPMFVWWGPELVNLYNDAYIPVLGKRHPQAFGRPALASWSDIWQVLAPQVEAVMAHGQATWNERVLLVMERNGFAEETYFTWSYSPIYREDGTVGGLFCACSEETPRVQAERERDELMKRVQETATTLLNWFDNAPGFIALLRGRQHVIEMVNKAYYQLVGHRDIVGRPVFEAMPDLRDQGYEEILASVLDSGEAFLGRGLRVMVQRQPEGPMSEAYVDLAFEPVFDQDGRVGAVFVQGQDVTEQIQAVKALRDADRRKDEFLATLAHELRNPLAPIRQAAALSKVPGVSAAQRDWAQGVIERQTRHMALLLDDLLDVSRVSMGKLTLRYEPVPLAQAVQAAAETVGPMLDARRHRLAVDLPTSPPIVLMADPLRLAQVLTNLLSNAAKYTPEGGRIELRARAAAPEVHIHVRDNGIGLSAQSRRDIFQMFSQVSTALERAEGGLGIGLALTRGLIELHGGTIEVHSDGLGKGAEFIVRLPWQPSSAVGLAAQEAPAPPSPHTPPSPESDALKADALKLEALEPDALGPDALAPDASGPGPAPRRIVVADDNVDAVQSLAMLLAFDGHDVHTAHDGEEAFEVIARTRPDVAILDIGMPRINGYQLAERIRAAPWGSMPVLIALTGWGQAHDQARARAAGFDHHCTKPLNPDSLAPLLAASRAAPPSAMEAPEAGP